MKTFKALYIDNGVIKAGEFPEYPELSCSSRFCPIHHDDCECDLIGYEHEEAIVSAKANAVVVEDQDKAMSFSWYGRVPESKIIPLPSGWDYRVVKRCTNCERLGCESISCRDPYDGSMSYTQVAILYRTVEQPEPEESQERTYTIKDMRAAFYAGRVFEVDEDSPGFDKWIDNHNQT